jgi:hypothetical protein
VEPVLHRRPAQRAGARAALLAHIEAELATRRGATLLLVETSGAVAFEPVRAFYRRNGFAEGVRVPDFCKPDDDKVTFRKGLTPAAAPPRDHWMAALQ